MSLSEVGCKVRLSLNKQEKRIKQYNETHNNVKQRHFKYTIFFLPVCPWLIYKIRYVVDTKRYTQQKISEQATFY